MPVPTLHHQQISDSDVGQRTAIFVEAACRCLKTHSLEHGLRAGERKDFRGTLDSDCLVHSLSLLLINVRLWANLVTSLGIYNAGVMAAHLGRLNEIIQGQSKHSMHVRNTIQPCITCTTAHIESITMYCTVILQK